MSFPAQPLLTWKICTLIIHVIGIALSLFRLIHRFRTRKLWWDDYVTILAVILDIVYCTTSWLRFTHHGPVTPAEAIQLVQSIWFSFLPYVTVIWASRVSAALSIARIFPSKHTARKRASGIAIIFIVVYFTCVLTSIFTCDVKPPRFIIEYERCKRGVNGQVIGGIFTVSADFASDMVLTGYPIWALRQLKLPPSQRRLILTAFSGSILTLLATVLFCIFWFHGPQIDLGPDGRLLMSMSGSIEVATSLIASNVVVVTPYFYRMMRKEVRKEKICSPYEVGEEVAPVSDTRGGNIPTGPGQSVTADPVFLSTVSTCTEYSDDGCYQLTERFDMKS